MKPYEHWTTRLVIGLAFFFTLGYLPYYLPRLFQPNVTFPTITNLDVPLIIAAAVTYFFIHRRIGHHVFFLFMILMLGYSIGEKDSTSTSFYLYTLAILTYGVFRSFVLIGREQDHHKLSRQLT